MNKFLPNYQNENLHHLVSFELFPIAIELFDNLKNIDQSILNNSNVVGEELSFLRGQRQALVFCLDLILSAKER